MVRVAKIKTENGFLIRPVQRLYPLEISSEESGNIRTKCVSLRAELPPRATSETSPDESKLSTNTDPSHTMKTDFVMRSSQKQRATRKGRLIKSPNRLNL